MSKVLCVTNRKLCKEDFLVRIEKIAACHPAGIILREKDLSPAEYRALAEPVMEICARHGTRCILHSFVEVALALQAQAIHLPLHLLRSMTQEERAGFFSVGASCHSAADALEAQALGCTYITAGHIFQTDCKKGLPGRGLNFLREVCRCVSVPVYAIGGIGEDNAASVRWAGANGVCLMSSVMVCEDVQELLRSMEQQK